MKAAELVVVATFRSVADAQLAQGILDRADIESLLRSDNAGGMYPALDSAALLVRAEDVNAAAEALKTLTEAAATDSSRSESGQSWLQPSRRPEPVPASAQKCTGAVPPSPG